MLTTTKKTRINGIIIEYDEYINDVSKSNVLILPGLGQVKESYSLFASYLNKYFNIFVLDLRGHGNSEKKEPFTLEQLMKDIVEFMLLKNFENTHLIAASFSSVLAQTIESEYPQLVGRIILLDGGYFNYFKSPNFHNKLLEFFPFPQFKDASEHNLYAKNVPNKFESYGWKYSKFVHKIIIKDFLDSYYQNEKGEMIPKISMIAYKKLYEEYAYFNIERIQSNLAKPVLLVQADTRKYSSIVQQFLEGKAIEFRKRTTKGYCHNLKESDHALNITNAEELSNICISFINFEF